MKKLPLLLAVLSIRLLAADELPPPELTEYYTPVPPVVAAPAGGVPSDAIVLFDGTSLDAWEPAKAENPMWRIEDGAMVVVAGKAAPEEAARVAATPGRLPDFPHGGIRTRQSFGDVQLHLEFRTPAKIEGKGQGRGNSGVFFMGRYEVQVLDSHDNPTYVNGQAGSIYKQSPPLVNASRPPGEWQTYDIVFFAPRFAADGSLASPARITAFHNGVLVQHNTILTGPTEYRGAPKYAPHAAKLPLELQEHGNPVAFRNIWVREMIFPQSR
jgi:Domain of Unknown Function (DUF1080)